MSNWVKILGNKVKSWTMILLCIQNFCLATTTKCHILAIILMHTKLNASKSAMPPLVVFFHAYDRPRRSIYVMDRLIANYIIIGEH